MRLLVTGGSGFIGTNLVQSALDQGWEVLNLDWNPPLKAAHRPWWREWNIMDRSATDRWIAEFRPTHLVHLAARTDTDVQDDLDAYRQNHEGTALLLESIKAADGLQRVIITSTQFVCEAGYQPKDDLDFKPFTLYGETKRRCEMAVRQADLPCTWSIIRPTTIWGPWSLRYRDVLFKVMRKGLYFHPGKGRVIRSYGYVGNVVWQIGRLLEVPDAEVHGKVFYVGDPPLDLRQWVEAISQALVGKPVRYIPTWIVKSMAMCGDVLKVVQLPFPITSGRFRSMTTDYITPMDRTEAALGKAPWTLEQGARAMVDWYDNESRNAVKPTLIDTRQKQVAPSP
ncbi:MAG TPA: NAD(P)-dependent oxidoreductase [Flavobacteriales bacterium]|nr:NAD(P)-dependent oxidoreductase [Flavobacteriales bacterium]HRP82235.1 NAD(P)-dependent oxidoreductase [Flavobacteriales bacterium]HRQ85052.1 NAD(P)-dependent oxidoreductase [Flavobacteriales bacterium]